MLLNNGRKNIQPKKKHNSRKNWNNTEKTQTEHLNRNTRSSASLSKN